MEFSMVPLTTTGWLFHIGSGFVNLGLGLVGPVLIAAVFDRDALSRGLFIAAMVCLSSGALLEQYQIVLVIPGEAGTWLREQQAGLFLFGMAWMLPSLCTALHIAGELDPPDEEGEVTSQEVRP